MRKCATSRPTFRKPWGVPLGTMIASPGPSVPRCRPHRKRSVPETPSNRSNWPAWTCTGTNPPGRTNRSPATRSCVRCRNTTSWPETGSSIASRGVPRSLDGRSQRVTRASRSAASGSRGRAASRRAPRRRGPNGPRPSTRLPRGATRSKLVSRASRSKVTSGLLFGVDRLPNRSLAACAVRHQGLNRQVEGRRAARLRSVFRRSGGRRRCPSRVARRNTRSAR
jgi:hypothetical protein